jgi:hypothetical protein
MRRRDQASDERHDYPQVRGARVTVHKPASIAATTIERARHRKMMTE